MGDTTAISWADHTFNPWIGCTKVSEACRNCYHHKQNGEWVAEPAGKKLDSFDPKTGDFSTVTAGNETAFVRIGKKRAGHLLDGQEWHQFPGSVGRG